MRLLVRATQKFARWPHIHILEGDSQKKIPEILATLKTPALFWLDAGYYGWAGLQGDKQRLTVELDSILEHSDQKTTSFLWTTLAASAARTALRRWTR